MTERSVELLIPQEKYLGAGAHIGTRTKNGTMREFIYKTREDGLHVLDLKKLDDHVRAAASLLAKYEPEKVFVVGSKENAKQALKKMNEYTGFHALIGRFTPGRFTNPSRGDFVEPEVILVIDPSVDKQAVKEAFYINIPVVALCDTNNNTKYVDLVIPTNNKGRKAIALIVWLLTREILKERGALQNNEDFAAAPEDFEA